jgi:hypothetical protein
MNPLTIATTVAESIMLAAAPHGGQRTARENALASIRADRISARDRAEALDAVAVATGAQARPATG